MPSVGVFIAWTDTPYTVSPVWTEISQYVRQISIRRGRQDDLQQFGPGTASLVLDNRDRLFDPFNSSGANYANLKPRKQLKIVANWNGTEYPLYRGYVSGWPVEYTDGGLDSTVTIECFDLLGLLATEILDTNLLFNYIMALNPTQFYTLDSLTSAATVTNAFGGITEQLFITKNYGSDANNISNVTFNSVSTPIAAGYAPVHLVSSVQSVALENSIIPSVSSRALAETRAFVGIQGVSTSASSATYNQNSVCFWYKYNLGSTSAVILITSAATGGQFQVQLDSSNRLLVNFGSSSARSSVSVNDSTAHCVVLTCNTAGQTNIYIDGRDCTDNITTSTSNAIASPLGTFYTGLGVRAETLQYIAFFSNLCLTQAQAQTLYELGLGSQEESGQTRVTDYFIDTSLPSGLYAVDSTLSTTVDEFPRTNSPLLPALRKVIDGDDGNVFVDKSGIVNAVGQDYLFAESRCNTSQMTFTDSGTGVGYDASSIRIDFNADQVRNQFILQGSFGIQATVEDATSVTQNGVAGQNVETAVQSVDDLESLASRRLTIYKNPKMQIEPFMAKGQANPSYNWPRLLSLELLDRVTFKRTPSVGSAIQKDLLVQSIEHRITPGGWQTVVNGSTRYTGWFILGVSLLGSTEDVLL
jgi:hypothetical protein